MPTPPLCPSPTVLPRRGFLALAGGTGLALALTACGDKGSGAPARHTVTTALGTYEVPDAPQRVFAVDGRTDLEFATALGLPVVGYTGAVPTWVPVSYGAKAFRSPVTLDEVRGTEPDLIVCTNVADPRWLAPGLAEIAPVLPIDPSLPWQQNLANVTGWLPGTAAAAQRMTETYDARVQRLRERFPEALADKRVALVSTFSGTTFSDRSFTEVLPGQVVADADATTLRFTESATLELGAEQVGALNAADAVLLFSESPYLEAESLPQDPLFGQVPAIAEGRFVLAPDLTFGSVYAALEIVEYLNQLYEKL